MVFAVSRNREEQQIEASLASAAYSRSAAIAAGVDVVEDAEDAICLFCDVTEDLTGEKFRAFADPFAVHEPGVITFAWIARVPISHRAADERAVGEENSPNIHPPKDASKRSVAADNRDYYFPILYAVPDARSRDLPGFDMSSDPLQRRAMEHALDTGKPAVISSAPSIHGEGETKAMYFYKPVYRRGVENDTAARRREYFRGFVLGVFSLAEIVEDALAPFSPEDMHVVFLDMSAPKERRLFYSYCLDETPSDADAAEIADASLRKEVDYQLQIGGSTWRMAFVPGADFVARHRSWQLWLDLAFGLTMTVVWSTFLFIIIYRLFGNERAAVERAVQCERAEKAAKEYAAALEEANNVLERCSVAAQSASQSKSEFLANMSHEIRTPLTAILGYADLLLGADPRVSDEQRQAVSTIKRNGEFLLAIINDILDLSKIEAGRLEVERTVCSPGKILADLRSLMSVGAEAKGLTFTVEYEGALPETILSDPVRLRQILLNLIANAIKFTRAGGVRVTARFESDPSLEHKLRFDVADTGIGISEEQMRRLFQPFSQADGATTRRFGGSGLGLTISKRLALMLGGDITVRSTPGEGSVFSVTVATGPLESVTFRDHSPDEAVEEAAASSAASPALHGRILLAEDGPDNQRLISFLLRKAGAEVEVAENGKEAVRMVLASNGGQTRKEWPFDLVLMDIQMPVMDGYEATQRLREGGYPGPIIALTAYAMPKDVQRCLEVGCDLHLSKPINFDTLLQAVAQNLKVRSPAGERTV
ncbi:MAG: CHASE domain-containing protein [Pirellulales bacterium]|nr:CHASE domain-containing protein [Pirellulales bacterium]